MRVVWDDIRRRRPSPGWCAMIVVIGLLAASPVRAAPSEATSPSANPLGIPDLSQFVPAAQDAEGVSSSLRILVLLTVLSLAPSILIMMTSFTRIVIVLALLRQAMGTQALPPSQVLVGMAMILTMVVMAPTWQKMKTDAVEPYLDGALGQRAALEKAAVPLRDFMFRQVEAANNEENVYLFVEYTRGPLAPDEQLDKTDVRFIELVPAFMLSELETAFVMGFRLYLPFLVIDMVISSILISMGMMMLPPVLISLPFKIMLFVLSDGWNLVVGSIMASFA